MTATALGLGAQGRGPGPTPQAAPWRPGPGHKEARRRARGRAGEWAVMRRRRSSRRGRRRGAPGWARGVAALGVVLRAGQRVGSREAAICAQTDGQSRAHPRRVDSPTAFEASASAPGVRHATHRYRTDPSSPHRRLRRCLAAARDRSCCLYGSCRRRQLRTADGKWPRRCRDRPDLRRKLGGTRACGKGTPHSGRQHIEKGGSTASTHNHELTDAAKALRAQALDNVDAGSSSHPFPGGSVYTYQCRVGSGDRTMCVLVDDNDYTYSGQTAAPRGSSPRTG